MTVFVVVSETSNLIWNGLKYRYRYEFSLVFINSFFILLYYSYEIRLQNFERLRLPDPKLHQIWYELSWRISTGTSFASFFFKSFFILLYYSYEMRLQKFKRHLPPDPKLHQSWYENSWRISTGTSFRSIFLNIFLFCSIIDTKYVCKISRGCAHPIRSYIKFGMNWAEEFLQVRVLPRFF